MKTEKIKEGENWQWRLWVKEWNNFYRYFNSRGNIDTKAKLKLKLCNGFIKAIEETQKQTIEEVKQIISEWLTNNFRSTFDNGAVYLGKDYSFALKDLLSKLDEVKE